MTPGLLGIAAEMVPQESRAMSVTLTRSFQVFFGGLLGLLIPSFIASRTQSPCLDHESPEVIKPGESILHSSRLFGGVLMGGIGSSLVLIFLSISLLLIRKKQKTTVNEEHSGSPFPTFGSALDFGI